MKTQEELDDEAKHKLPQSQRSDATKDFEKYEAYQVRLGGGERIVTKNVLPFGTGGGGAILRAAAQRGCC